MWNSTLLTESGAEILIAASAAVASRRRRFFGCRRRMTMSKKVDKQCIMLAAGLSSAAALHIDVSQVNVKATTEEGLGFTGTEQGISSQAICALTTIYESSVAVADSQAGCEGCAGCRKQS